MRKCLVLASAVLICAVAAAGQDQTRPDRIGSARVEPSLELGRGVAAHKEIDAIYKAFSEAYRDLDLEKVAGLYTATAAYLPPDSEILNGREAIRPTFKSSFDWIRKEGRTMTISFQIFQRRVDRDLAYDVGVYTNTQYKDGKEVSVGKGKFVVVAVREKSGSWRFQVDGFSGLRPFEEK